MRCPSCGLDNSPAARYCARCGTMLRLAEGETLKRGQLVNGGQYRVLRRLGGGGMGSIYLAQNTQAFDRPCVIKEMSAYYEADEEQEAQERFEREARTLAALKHPGIPDMYSYFSEGGRYYIVIEYIEGDNLEGTLTREDASGDKVQGHPLDVESAVRYAVEICRVLEYLAQVKPEPVVHCDIKPSNIIIDRNSQQAVLVDFGTSIGVRKVEPADASPDAAAAASAAPAAVGLYGTVGYAAPEMYQGQAVPRSDIFSLAATLYHLLTDDDPRDHPFQWPQMERIPESLRETIRRALSTETAARPDAEELRRELETYRAGLDQAVQPIAFPDGNTATTLTGVLDLALRYWEYTRQILLDGTLDTWLRATLHDTATADHARQVLGEFPDAPDAALDDLLRSLNPRLPPPHLSLATVELDLGTLAPGEERVAEIRLTNQGPGGAHGTIASSVPWLQASPAQFALPPGGACNVRLRPTALDTLPTDAPQTAQVTIAPMAGQPLAVEARLRTVKAAPARTVPPTTRLATGQQRAGSATRTSRPVVPRPPAASGAARQARPTRATARPVARPTARVHLWWILLILAVLAAAGGGGVWLFRGPWAEPPSASLERGIAALRGGRWSEAVRTLSRVDPADPQQVRQVALALDGDMPSIPAGTLSMGRDDGSLDERPMHDVQVPGFLMDRFEVTNVQYQRFVDETGHAPPSGWLLGHFPRDQALQPVVNVTWQDARDYAAWAGKRLPTEAEWEWAARGDSGRLYPWGNDVDPSRANSGHPDGGSTVAVGSYPSGATPQGIMDLAGNVREWTADRYGPYEPPDYAPPTSGSRIAVRGSSWRSFNEDSPTRSWAEATTRADDLGFRCVR